MAKYEAAFKGDFYTILSSITSGIRAGSISADLEDSSDFTAGGAKCSVRVFERYSALGGNRVSLAVTIFQASGDDKIHLSAIASGGSQAMFFKINTFGEQAFLDCLKEVLAELKLGEREIGDFGNGVRL